MWTRLVTPDPCLAVTPYWPSSIPTDDDVTRLRGYGRLWQAAPSTGATEDEFGNVVSAPQLLGGSPHVGNQANTPDASRPRARPSKWPESHLSRVGRAAALNLVSGVPPGSTRSTHASGIQVARTRAARRRRRRICVDTPATNEGLGTAAARRHRLPKGVAHRGRVRRRTTERCDFTTAPVPQASLALSGEPAIAQNTAFGARRPEGRRARQRRGVTPTWDTGLCTILRALRSRRRFGGGR
jgi:hypothetical protein